MGEDVSTLKYKFVKTTNNMMDFSAISEEMLENFTLLDKEEKITVLRQSLEEYNH